LFKIGKFAGQVDVPTMINCPQVKQLSLGPNSMLILTVQNKILGYGKNAHAHLDNNEAVKSVTAFQPIPLPPKLLKQQITKIATGNHFSLFVTERGELWARGDAFLEILFDK